MTERCFIMGAADMSGVNPVEFADYIIAADGGYANLKKTGIEPDLVVGDFDSLSMAPEHPNVITLPREKDDTDMLFAVKQGLKLGYRIFYLDGGIGGRFDHSFANIQTLSYIAQNQARGYILAKDFCITVIKNSSLQFKAGLQGYISVFSLNTDSTGIIIDGLKYELSNGKLQSSLPLGVSNEFVGKSAMIKTDNGLLAVIWEGTPRDIIE